MCSYSVVPYSIENLIEVISCETKTPEAHVQDKLHLIFFESYFSELNASTIVVEHDYIDHDYLEDYAYYYVKSFKPYKRFCIRLHFFTHSFDSDGFRDAIMDENTSKAEFSDSYLGFIVLKPLPQTYIGRSCLKTYPAESNRYFHFIRNYDVSLFGLELAVKTIAFQEQDSVVAACASSAIWSAFQVTGKLFQHPIPTPVEITRSAIELLPNLSRHFPNKGLNAEQMAQAIRSVGLDPYLVTKTHQDVLKATVYAYQKARIPLILGMDLVELNGKREVIGKHAVAITGYSMAGSLSKFAKADFYLNSSKIDKLYVHDDQVGPFARMEFNGDELTTSWKDSAGKIGKVVGVPDIVIIPLYKKIRIPYELILQLVNNIDEYFNVIINKAGLNIPQLTWDIFLSKNNDFKKELIQSTSINKVQKHDILIQTLPRYIWRAIGDVGGAKIEFLFDSTDIEQGEIFICCIPHDKSVFDLFKLVASYIDVSVIRNSALVKVFESLKD